MDLKNQTKKLILDHYKRYPGLQIRDIFKFLHQSSFGCEHLLADPSAAVDYIRREAREALPHEGETVEMLDGNFVRVYLDCLKDGLDAQTFGTLFYLSAKPQEDGRERLEEKLAAVLEMVRQGQLPFDEEILEISVSLYVIGAPDITRDLDSLGASLHRDKSSGKVASEHRIDCRMELPVTHGFKLDVSV